MAEMSNHADAWLERSSKTSCYEKPYSVTGTMLYEYQAGLKRAPKDICTGKI